MPKLLVLANLELSFEYPAGNTTAEELARKKQRQLVRLLRRLVSEDPAVQGSMERLELEAFGYADPLEAEPSGYYYDKVERQAAPENGN